jgi:NAD(P)-dependent dehydrogenase (short-subunit alcohol dehydrogenase family)
VTRPASIARSCPSDDTRSPLRRRLRVITRDRSLFAVHRCDRPSRSGRSIVTFGGGGATAPLPRFDAYAASKAVVARLTENLAAALAPLAVDCVAPGFIATRLRQVTLATGTEAAGAELYERTRQVIGEGGFSAAEAAELMALLLEDPPCSRKLISARWDPWRYVAFQRPLAEDRDLGTVRRIDGFQFDRTKRGA